MLKNIRVLVLGLCLLFLQREACIGSDLSWMTYSWVEEGETAKRLETTINKYGPEETLKIYRQSAEEGDAEAQFFICMWYLEGVVYEKSEPDALKWLKRSVEGGYKYAQMMLGEAYFEGSFGLERDVECSLTWLEKSATDGNKYGQWALANFYADTSHELANASKAYKLYTNAAEKGNADAQRNLAFCYLKGTGVDIDIDKGEFWMKKAAAQGEPFAQFELGLLYYHGIAKSGQDFGRASKWLKKAAKQGYPEAEYTLGCIFHKGEGVDKDSNLAMEWFVKAGNNGHRKAQLYLAKMYMYDAGVLQDKVKAIHWFTMAANHGDVQAQEALMYIYESGDGVGISLSDSAKWALKAARNGNVSAQIRLIHAYDEGLGVATDHAESYAWAIIADHNGEPDYKKTVEPMFSVDEKVDGFRRSRILEKEIEQSAENK